MGTTTTIATTNFSRALEMLVDGQCIQRLGWNGKGMYLYLVPASSFDVNKEPLLSLEGEGTKVFYRAHIDMKTADGSCVPWLASQSDLLEDDWVKVHVNPKQSRLGLI